MIVFDLQCGDNHVFEAWFGSSADYEEQREKGLVSCPICGSGDISKALMAPAVGTKGNRKKDGSGVAGDKAVSVSNTNPDPAQMKAVLESLAKEQAKALENSDYVGDKFADEARAMHDGEIDERPIHGQTTIEDAKSLVEDGVPVAPLPLPVRPPKSDN
ncbi:DUF1178 family protein [Parasphingopyxis sp.]|uniref:DUF1178 family protein n=1 Tax=Parasphingopyxis sp. TaxID=1920299 RepID=UPI002618BA64|nr:DUF1178 family protein [Parasphingopyxis sp.]